MSGSIFNIVSISDEYWQAVNPIFDYLDECKKSGMLWREMEEKDSKVYVPLLNAFETEIKNAYLKDKNLPRKLVEYLLGEYDFYKVISVDSQQMTQLQTYNMHGTLNKPAKKQKPKKIVPISTLPTKIVAFDFTLSQSLNLLILAVLTFGVCEVLRRAQRTFYAQNTRRRQAQSPRPQSPQNSRPNPRSLCRQQARRRLCRHCKCLNTST